MSIQSLIDSMPRWAVGLGAVTLGIVYFVLTDPPKTICDSQFEAFKEEYKKDLFGGKSGGIELPPLFKAQWETCRDTNSIGGCFEFLNLLKKVLPGIKLIPDVCGERLSELKPLQKSLRQSLWLISQLSWPVKNDWVIGTYNWLGPEDIGLFCQIKTQWKRLLGEAKWQGLQEQLLQEHIKNNKEAGKDPISRQGAWERSVLSFNCLRRDF